MLKYGWISALLLQTTGLLACVAVRGLIPALPKLYIHLMCYILCLQLYKALYSLLYIVL